ncbi:MAG TPA: GAF domain-containing protein, partial [Gammaproteobacteria bacterium]|nr:GAF domain-containing protein [Gammaproteobacteria bacterium]
MIEPDLPYGHDPEGGNGKTKEAFRDALLHWRAVIDAIHDPIFIHDPDGCLLRVNAAYLERAGGTFDTIIGRPYWEVFPLRDGPLATCNQVAENHHEHRERITTPAGETFLSRAFPIMGEEGQPLAAVHILEDITQDIRQNEALGQLNRALRVISGGNRSMLRASTEQELLDGVCQTAVERGGFRLVWVGMREDDAARSVRPVAWAGPETDYLEGLTVTWADTEAGQGPTGRAIREEQPVAAQNITGDPRFEPWRDTALEHGFRASLALPLRLGDTVWG